MIVYIALLLIILLFAFANYNRKTNKEEKDFVFFLFSSSLITVVSGLRGYSVGDDTKNYALWFNILSKLSFKELLNYKTLDIEIGYRIYNYALSKLWNNPRIVIFVSSAIIVFSLFFFLYKYSYDYFLSIILFLGLNHFFTSINTYRLYLAISVVIWLYHALQKKRVVLAFALSLLGFFIHRISIAFSIGLVIAFILKDKRRNVIIVLISEMIMVPLIPRIINLFVQLFPKYKYYLNLDNSIPIGKMNILFFVLELIIILICVFVIDIDDAQLNMEIILLSICSVLRVVGNNIPRGFRFVQIFSLVLLLLIPRLISKDKLNRNIYIFAVTLFSCALYFYFIINNAGDFVPYVFLK